MISNERVNKMQLPDHSPLPATPSKAQQQWMGLGYGPFIHFGPNTFTLNAGPDKRGLMPQYHQRFLAAAANELGLLETW